MKERPIIFSAEMVCAILDGRKTQTRRVIKTQPLRRIDPPGPLFEQWEFPCKVFMDDDSLLAECPYGQPGDRLWVRETWAVAPPAIHYRADNDFKSFPDEPRLYDYASTQGWRPSIFMPRWASRITLEITNVRVERVQDISPENIYAEGVYHNKNGYLYPAGRFEGIIKYDIVTAFKGLWDSINAKRGYGWNSNPWVWVVEFALLDAAEAGQDGRDSGQRLQPKQQTELWHK